MEPLALTPRQSSRLTWLTAVLAQQRGKISFLLGRMTGLGTPGSMKPTLFGKFLCMLEQVASAREKELKIINRIEEIEERHRCRRIHHQLRAPSPTPRQKLQPLYEDESEAPKPRHGLLWFLGMMYLMTRTGINQKKQGLTVD